jgi:hypothetical protein
MTVEIDFYTSCMKHEAHPGVVANGVQLAGIMIKGLGDFINLSGDLFFNYACSAGPLSGFALANGIVVEKVGGNSPISLVFAFDRLKESGIALAIGGGLTLISTPVTRIGKWMQARETQCAIGQSL